jgi:hypothetical protein
MVVNLHPKCANPSCAASFDWLGGGRLFRFPRHIRPAHSTGSDDTAAANPNPIGHFWLCEHCANIYTLKDEPSRGVVIAPLRPELPPASPDMRLPSL